MNKLVNNVEKWFIDRNMVDDHYLEQYIKLNEEYGELCDANIKNNNGLKSDDISEIMDAIGDMQVVAIGLNLKSKCTWKPHLIFNIPERFDLGSWVLELSDTTTILAKIGVTLGKMGEELLDNGYAELETYQDLIYLLKTYLSNLKGGKIKKTPKKALELAYEEIKDRKGYTDENGVFHKED